MDTDVDRWQEFQRLIAAGKLIARDDGWFDVKARDFVEARNLVGRNDSILRFTPGGKSRFQLRLNRFETSLER